MFIRLLTFILFLFFYNANAASEEKGLKQFCTATNGFNLAKRGAINPEKCSGYLGTTFQEGFKDGRELRNLNVRVKNAGTHIKNNRIRIQNSKNLILQKEYDLKGEKNAVNRKFLRRDIKKAKKLLKAQRRESPRLERKLKEQQRKLGAFREYAKKYDNDNQSYKTISAQNSGVISVPTVIIYNPGFKDASKSTIFRQRLTELQNFLPISDNRQFYFKELTEKKNITIETDFGKYNYSLGEKPNQITALFSDGISEPKLLVLKEGVDLTSAVKKYFNVFGKEHLNMLAYSLSAENSAPNKKKQQFQDRYNAFLSSFANSKEPNLTEKQSEKINNAILSNFSVFSSLIDYSIITTRNYFQKPFREMYVQTPHGVSKVRRDQNNRDTYHHEFEKSKILQQRFFKYSGQGVLEKVLAYNTEAESSLFDEDGNTLKVKKREREETSLFWESDYVLDVFEGIRVTDIWDSKLKDVRGSRFYFNTDYTLQKHVYFSYNHTQQEYSFTPLSEWQYFEGGKKVIQTSAGIPSVTYIYKDGQVKEIIQHADDKNPNSVYYRSVIVNNEKKLYDEMGNDVTRFPQKYIFDKKGYLIKSEGFSNTEYKYKQ